MPYLTIAKWVGGGLLGLGLAWAIYAGILRPVLKPNPSTTQKAEEIINYNYPNPKVVFGCMRFVVNGTK
jgi:hypothetical protein